MSMLDASEHGALYLPKKADGSWDWEWSTVLQVIAWAKETGVTSGTPVYTGWVIPPEGDGSAAADLIPAKDAHITGSDGRAQHFVRYVGSPNV